MAATDPMLAMKKLMNHVQCDRLVEQIKGTPSFPLGTLVTNLITVMENRGVSKDAIDVFKAPTVYRDPHALVLAIQNTGQVERVVCEALDKTEDEMSAKTSKTIGDDDNNDCDPDTDTDPTVDVGGPELPGSFVCEALAMTHKKPIARYVFDLPDDFQFPW
jgi:hypothetical protein